MAKTTDKTMTADDLQQLLEGGNLYGKDYEYALVLLAQMRQANALERIATQLEKWDNGGGINLVPGETMRDLMGRD